jgi:hypothetical protein
VLPAIFVSVEPARADLREMSRQRLAVRVCNARKTASVVVASSALPDSHPKHASLSTCRADRKETSLLIHAVMVCSACRISRKVESPSVLRALPPAIFVLARPTRADSREMSRQRLAVRACNARKTSSVVAASSALLDSHPKRASLLTSRADRKDTSPLSHAAMVCSAYRISIKVDYSCALGNSCFVCYCFRV